MVLGERSFDASQEKKAVRFELLQRRLALNSQVIKRKSLKISNKLFLLPYFAEAERIALYSPIKNEVLTEKIFKKSKELGKVIYFPRVESASLTFCRVNNFTELMPGKFGVLEPNPDSETIPAKNLDLIIIPGVAFDRVGRRIGYGKGYYDRILLEVGKEKRAALAYGFQVVDFLPEETGDARMGIVVTESEIILM